jgi:hypothetical protein
MSLGLQKGLHLVDAGQFAEERVRRHGDGRDGGTLDGRLVAIPTILLDYLGN